MLKKPSIEEYTSYHGRYVDLVPEGNLEDNLLKQLEKTTQLLSTISEEQATYCYAPGKWTLKEVVGHIADTERIMSYRLLRIARGDKTPLAGFDQDDFVKGASFQSCTLPELIEDYTAVRRSTLTLLRGLSEESWSRKGVASNNEISVRALAYIIAGHELYHVKAIKERYLA
ncbi:DinB family protein [Bradyrhizobium japonicum]|uniref:DinB family protein n=1 Tax=Bradyrhizobium japonicum TaxID=375 RepID=UPI0009B80E3E|nr:DinB family protein [Bradyrhizobium japonicum]